MFSYCPSKGSCWGHALHPKNALKAIHKTYNFFEKYFKPVEAKGLTLILNPYQDTAKLVPKIRERLVETFGRTESKESLNWIFTPNDYQRMIKLILDCGIVAKLPSDPIWLSFSCGLKWKTSVLPIGESPDVFAETVKSEAACPMLEVNLRHGGRFMFPLGIQIPISPNLSASYEFLRMFSADAPFKMSSNNFQVLMQAKNGKMMLRRPDEAILARLTDAVDGCGKDPC